MLAPVRLLARGELPAIPKAHAGRCPSEGRKTVSLSLRGDYQKRYFADLTYVAAYGGAYDELRDRDYLSLAAGNSF